MTRKVSDSNQLKQVDRQLAAEKAQLHQLEQEKNTIDQVVQAAEQAAPASKASLEKAKASLERGIAVAESAVQAKINALLAEQQQLSSPASKPSSNPTANSTTPPRNADTATIKDFLRQAAGDYGVNGDLLVDMAKHESSFRPDVVAGHKDLATSPNAPSGLMQFRKSTFDRLAAQARAAKPELWKGLGGLDSTDWRQQALTAAWAISKGKGHLWSTYQGSLKRLGLTDFHARPGASKPTHATTPGKTQPPASSGGGQAAYDVADKYMGKWIADLKKDPVMGKYLDGGISNKQCCANFVSACLEKAGLIPPSGHKDRGSALAKELSNSSDWKSVYPADGQVPPGTKPGDVVELHVPGEGDYGHTVMFAGWNANGKPLFIGSNNTRTPDGKLGPQQISKYDFLRVSGYSITAVFHYTGSSS